MSGDALIGVLSVVGMLVWVNRVKRSRTTRWLDWVIGLVVSAVVLYALLVAINIATRR